MNRFNLMSLAHTCFMFYEFFRELIDIERFIEQSALWWDVFETSAPVLPGNIRLFRVGLPENTETHRSTYRMGVESTVVADACALCSLNC